jgi:hypothetical protein
VAFGDIGLDWIDDAGSFAGYGKRHFSASMCKHIASHPNHLIAVHAANKYRTAPGPAVGKCDGQLLYAPSGVRSLLAV